MNAAICLTRVICKANFRKAKYNIKRNVGDITERCGGIGGLRRVAYCRLQQHKPLMYPDWPDASRQRINCGIISYMPASTNEKNIARFQFGQNCLKGHIEVLDWPDRPAGCVFDTLVIDHYL